MAQRKDTTNFGGLLFQFMGTEDPMLNMLEWLCDTTSNVLALISHLSYTGVKQHSIYLRKRKSNNLYPKCYYLKRFYMEFYNVFIDH